MLYHGEHVDGMAVIYRDECRSRLLLRSPRATWGPRYEYGHALLAKALLLDLLDTRAAYNLSTRFGQEVVTQFGERWSISSEMILDWAGETAALERR